MVSACPKYFFYNWACHARLIWCWLHSYLDSAFCIDSWACSPPSLWGLLNWKNITKEVKANTVVYNAVKVFFSSKNTVFQKKGLSLCWRLSLGMATSTSVFYMWKARYIKVFGDLFKEVTHFFSAASTVWSTKEHFFGHLEIVTLLTHILPLCLIFPNSEL